MARNNLLFIFILLTSFRVLAQDSILIEPNVKPAKIYFAFDANRSLFSDPNVKFNGLKLGVELLEKHRIGISYHVLSEPVRFVGRMDKVKYPEASDTLLFNFSYFSHFYERVWLRTKRWELTSPIHTGIGAVDLSYVSSINHIPVSYLRTNVFTVALGGSAQFKVFRWFALGVGVGYRHSLSREVNIAKSLNAPYYQFQVKVLFGQLIRMAFKGKEIEKWE
jgi:hypothetical protein